MKHSSLSRTLFGLGALATVAVAGAQTIRRDTVIPIRFEDTVRLSTVRVGDPIRAIADGASRDIPNGSVFEGRVRTVRRPAKGQNGYVEFEFTTLRLSSGGYGVNHRFNTGDRRDDRSGQRYDIRAVPIPLNGDYTERDRDGRIQMRQRKGVGRDTAVLGGGLAGLALGSLLKKPLEGAIVGLLGGIAVAETNRGGTSDVILDKNTRMGAAFQRDVTIDRTNDRSDDRDGWGRDRDDRWGRDRDDRWDDRDSYNPVIRYKDRDLRFDGRERPYRLGSTAMLPAEATARQLGVRFNDQDNRAIVLDGPYGVARVSRDSSRATIDGREINLPRPAVERDGVLYVPAEVFGRILREALTIDGTSAYRRSF